MTHKIPNSIAQKRKERGLSQDSLSQMLGITITQLSRLENGKSSLTQKRMHDIAKILEVKPQELYLAPHQTGKIDLKIIHEIIEQVDQLLVQFEVTVSSKKRADLCIAIYRREIERLEDKGLTSADVDAKLHEDMVKLLKD